MRVGSNPPAAEPDRSRWNRVFSASRRVAGSVLRPDTVDPRFAALLGIVAVAVAMAVWVCLVEPIDHGHGRYATIAEHMVRSGDFVVPRLNGEVYLNKPPLFVWLVSVSIAVLGTVPSWASHLPNMVAAVVLLVISASIAGRVGGSRRLRWGAALVVASCLLFVEQSRGERLDPVFAAFLCAALSAYFRAERVVAAGGRGLVAFLSSGSLLGLATLTKGPVGPALFIATVLPYALISARRRQRSLLPGVLILSAALIAIVAPWPLLFVARLDPGRVLELIRETDFATRDRAWTYYLLEIPQALSPWSLFLPALIVWLYARRPYRDNPGLQFALCWVIGPLLLLQCSDARSGRYLLPILPAIAVLIAAMLGEVWAAAGAADPSRSGEAATRAPAAGVNGAGMPGSGESLAGRLAHHAYLAMLFLMPLAAFAGTAVLAWRREAFWAPAVASIVIVPWSVRCFRAARAAVPRRSLVAAGLMASLCFATLDLLRAMDFAQRDPRPEAERALLEAPAGIPLLGFDLDRPDAWVVPLIVRQGLPEVDDRGQLSRLLGGRGSDVCLIAGEQETLELEADSELRVQRLARFHLRRRPLWVLRAGASR